MLQRYEVFSQKEERHSEKDIKKLSLKVNQESAKPTLLFNFF